MMVTARRNGPFTPRVATAMRRFGWFIIIGSTVAAVVHLIAIDALLTIMTKITSPFPNLILVPLHLPIPILTGAALLTFARIITAGAAMDAEIRPQYDGPPRRRTRPTVTTRRRRSRYASTPCSPSGG